MRAHDNKIHGMTFGGIEDGAVRITGRDQRVGPAPIFLTRWNQRVQMLMVCLHNFGGTGL